MDHQNIELRHSISPEMFCRLREQVNFQKVSQRQAKKILENTSWSYTSAFWLWDRCLHYRRHCKSRLSGMWNWKIINRKCLKLYSAECNRYKSGMQSVCKSGKRRFLSSLWFWKVTKYKIWLWNGSWCIKSWFY